MMNEARVGGTVVRRVGRRAARNRRPPRARPATCWDGSLTTSVEITAPDRESASALLGEAGPHFRAELVDTAGSEVVVRLQPAGAGSASWVFELLALVERWLEAHRLPVADARYAGRSYLIQVPAPDRQWGDVEPLSVA
jgi:hypothetical protein